MSTKLMRLRSVIGLVSLAAAVAQTASCGDVVRTGRAPVVLSVTGLKPSLVTSSVTSLSDDQVVATLAVTMKDVSLTTPATPTANNNVTITEYQVVYRRTDGRSTQGTDVPFAFSGAATLQIVPNASGDLTFELVRQVAKQEGPLAQITDSNVVTMIADVTFFGRDQVGNELSATGSMTINFRK